MVGKKKSAQLLVGPGKKAAPIRFLLPWYRRCRAGGKREVSLMHEREAEGCGGGPSYRYQLRRSHRRRRQGSRFALEAAPHLPPTLVEQAFCRMAATSSWTRSFTCHRFRKSWAASWLCQRRDHQLSLTCRPWTWPRALVEILRAMPSDEVASFETAGCTVGAYIVFPYASITDDGKWPRTINQARGTRRKVSDRFDLTLECIRRHYLQQDSPLQYILHGSPPLFRALRILRGVRRLLPSARPCGRKQRALLHRVQRLRILGPAQFGRSVPSLRTGQSKPSSGPGMSGSTNTPSTLHGPELAQATVYPRHVRAFLGWPDGTSSDRLWTCT